ncbi:hypothetical protein [Pseudorhodoferax sp.]|uniref:hypothetical protein n=1 Tax=Pseudorhodoferax sp. TaxID=1993553 RepID=UPI002DD635E7|nr:hypothetical protein [Pseudorhodoferax sp.]
MTDTPSPDPSSPGFDAGDPLPQAERVRFLEALPWWLGGSLAGSDPAEQAWMDATRQRSRWAAAQAAREQALAASVAAPEPADARLGLDMLLQRVRAEGVAAPAARTWLQRLLGMPFGARLVPVLALLVVVQAGLLGWQVWAPEPSAMRSGPVAEVRTLRVRFVPDVTEAQLRSVLLKAGARVVGGPNQLGEYWLASDIRSLDEMRQVLQGSGLARSIEVDTQGPPNAR